MLKQYIKDFPNIEWNTKVLTNDEYTKWQVPNYPDNYFIHSFISGKTAIIKHLGQKYNHDTGNYKQEITKNKELEKLLQKDSIYKFKLTKKELLEITQNHSNFVALKKRHRDIETQIFEHPVLGKMLIVRFYNFISHIPTPNEKGYYKEIWRLYISFDNNKICFSQKLDKEIEVFEKFNLKKMLTWLNKYYDDDKLFNVFLDFNKKFRDVSSFITTIPCAKTNNKTQLKIDEYRKLIKNDNLLLQNTKFSLDKSFYQTKDKKSFERYIVCQRLKENLIVFRLFSANNYLEEPFEYLSIIVDDKRIYPCYVNINEEYIHNKKLHNWSANTKYLNYDVKGTILEKKLPNIDNLRNKVLSIIFMDRYLYFEQLIKLGYSIAAEDMYYNNYYDYDMNWWKKKINPIHKCSYNINQFLEINNKTLKIFPTSSTLEDIIDGVLLIKKYNLNTNLLTQNDGIIINKECHSLDRFIEYLSSYNLSKEFLSTFLITLIQTQGKRNRDLFYTIDSIKMTLKYNKFLEIKDNVENIEKICFNINNMSNRYIEKYHNTMTKKIELMDFEIFNNSIKEIEKNYQYFNYQNNEFLIRLPKSAKEVVDEGKILKHCVASYIEEMANKKTFIFFIRKIDNQDIPYYTLELTKEKEIIQIHGYDNVEIWEDDDYEKLLLFVNQWCNEKRIYIPDWL